MDKLWLEDSFLSELNSYLFKDLLTVEHLNPFKIEIKKMNIPDPRGGFDSEDNYNFRGWEFNKNNTKYLVSDTINGKMINITDLLPILPQDCVEVGSKGFVYKHVKKPITMKIRPEKHWEFHEFLGMLYGIQHSNPDHNLIGGMLDFASTVTRFNHRRSTNPGFGKDFNVSKHNNITGRCFTIESPTLAKLEERSVVSKWLAVNEVCNMTAENWRITQGYLLAFGAHKNEVTKHSRAHGHVGEVIKNKELSLSLFFNDITEYKDHEKYFDFVTDGNVKDRFPGFRLYGKYIEDFNHLVGSNDPIKYAKENIDFFRKVLYTYEYYRLNYKSHIHGYDRSAFSHFKGRDAINIGRFLDIVDLASPTQERFNYYISVIKGSMQDYKDMLRYPYKFKHLLEKMDIPKGQIEKAEKNLKEGIRGIKTYIYSRYYDKTKTKWKNEGWKYNFEYIDAIQHSDTFTQKTFLCDNYINPSNKPIKDANIWGD